MFLKAFRKISIKYAKLKSIYWLVKMQLVGKTNITYVQLGKNINLQCPVRVDGNGFVTIGNGATLGYHKTPRYGNGEIIIWARSENAKVEIGSHFSISNNISIIANQSITIRGN